MREKEEITQIIQLTSITNSQYFDKYLKSAAALTKVKLWKEQVRPLRVP